MLKEGKRLKTWEEIKAERTKSSATKTQKSWAEIKKERGYVEPQSSIKEEQAAGATPALPAEDSQQQPRSSGFDLMKSNSNILQGKSTAPIGTTGENPFISEGKRLQGNVENAKTALVANNGSKEYREQLTKAAEEYERWKQQHPAFVKEVEPTKVGKFLLEKGASGAAESSEGFLNALSRAGQMLNNQQRQQSLESQATAAFLFGDKEQSTELLQQAADAGVTAYGRDQQLVEPFEFGDRYSAKVEEKYADANLSKGQRFLGDVAQGVGGLVPSIAANVVVPGSGMAVMTAGAFGNAVQEAKKAGADDATATAYGLAVGAVEAATEKIWGGMGGLFGKGAVDDLVKSAIANNIKSGAARAALTTAVSMFGEGVEEFLAEYGQLIANKLTVKTDDRKVWSRETLGDAGKSALIGAIIGGLMNIGESIEAGKTPQQAVETAAEEAAEIVEIIEKQPNTDDPNAFAQGFISTVLSQKRINNTTANEIIKTPLFSDAFTNITGVKLEGTVEQQRELIKKTLRNRQQLAIENEQIAIQAGIDSVLDYKQELEELARLQDEETVKNSGYRSYIRGIFLKGANTEDAMEIVNNPTLRAEWENVTGKTLPQNSKSAIKMIKQTDRNANNIELPDIFENQDAEATLKAAEEKLKKAVETNRAKAAERKEEIPKIELKGIEEKQTTNTKSEEEIPRIELPGIEETAKVPAKAGNESQRDIARRIGDYIEESESKKTSPAELGIKDGGKALAMGEGKNV